MKVEKQDENWWVLFTSYCELKTLLNYLKLIGYSKVPDGYDSLIELLEEYGDNFFGAPTDYFTISTIFPEEALIIKQFIEIFNDKDS